MEAETIAAISTAIGEGGIAIIRVSGDNSIELVNKVFKGKKRLTEVSSHTINYGYIIDQNEAIIDEVLVSIMRAPNTFTREDVVEINCHGGMVAAKRILDLVLEYGAKLAEPGEFTKRAFLNGRIDLSQAEAIIDLIRSKTDRAMKVAMNQVEGKLSNRINQIRGTLLEVLAHIEVTIDYPEHDIEELTHNFIFSKLSEARDDINKLINKSSQGKILREGISTVIIGRPNVGKSSLLNTMINENRAIVTEIPGTTRDIIEEYININGVPLRLVDTAGIRETEDVVEKIGVEKSKKELEKADLVLLVLNYNDELIAEDLGLIELVKDVNTIIIINKKDLPKKMDTDKLKDKIDNIPIIYTSITEGVGIDELEEAISNLFFEGKLDSDDLSYVSNSRHIDLLKKSRVSIDDAISSIGEWLPIDVVAIDIKNTMDNLGEIIGDAVSEELTNEIFAKFCVGK